MRRVVLESPLSGDFELNQRYARWCMLECLRRGEAPFASHLLYTQCLDDLVEKERDLGILAGLEWGEGTEHVFYVDLCPQQPLCMSKGMQIAYDKFGGEIRRLCKSMWEKFQRGEAPRGTPGSHCF